MHTAKDWLVHEKEVKANPEPMMLPHSWTLEDHARRNGEEHYDGKKYPLLCYVMNGQVKLFCTDPEICQELCTTKNNQIDKDGMAEALFSNIKGRSFLFGKSTEDWNLKRKHCAHAFFKAPMYDMQENFKRCVMKSINKWIKEIKESKDGKTTIDICNEFMHLYSRNIITITCGGEDHSTTEFPLQIRDPNNWNNLITKQTPMWKGFNLMIEDDINQMALRLSNPVNYFWRWTQKLYPLGKFQNATDNNGRQMRDYIRKLVLKRIDYNANNPNNKIEFDFLNHILSDKEAFPVLDDVVDAVCDFFSAAAQTTQAGSVTTQCHLIKEPEDCEKVRKEFEELKANQIANGVNLDGLTKEEQLNKLVNADTCEQLPYLGYVSYEALRYQSPSSTASDVEFLEDMEVCNYKFKKGDKLGFIMDKGLHHNTSQW